MDLAVSPNQILGHSIGGSCVLRPAAFEYRVLIALANACRSFCRHELITSVAANDRNFTTTQPLAHRVIGRDVTYLIAIDEVVPLISLNSRQAVLFDQLRDLRLARFLVRLLDALAAQLLIARDFGQLGLLRRELSA